MQRSENYIQRCKAAGVDPERAELSARKAALVARVDPSTMARWCHRRRLRHFALGAELRVLAEDLDAFLCNAERPALEAG